MSEVKQVPKLRFEGFEDKSSYEKHQFKDVFLFTTGKNIKQSEASTEFEIPCVRYGELYHMYNEVIYKIINRTNLDKSELLFSKGDEILLPSAGEDPLDIGSASALTIENIAIGRTINILRPIKDNIYSQSYVSYYINQKLKKKISTLARGSSISNVYNSDLKKLEIILPNTSEQKKIASFLTAVDEKITQLQQKKTLLEQYKKGVMQKIFSQELRFKDDEGKEYGDWEEKRLGDIGKLTGGGTPSSSNKDYWNGSIPWISSSDIYESSIRKISITRKITRDAIIQSATKIVSKDSLLIVSRVGIGKFAVAPEDLCTSQDFTNLESNENTFFLAYYLSCKKNLLFKLSQGTSIKGFTSKDLGMLKIKLPCIEEQTKTANFLSAIDAKIQLVNTQLENTQQFKKGLLQQLFV